MGVVAGVRSDQTQGSVAGWVSLPDCPFCRTPIILFKLCSRHRFQPSLETQGTCDMETQNFSHSWCRQSR